MGDGPVAIKKKPTISVQSLGSIKVTPTVINKIRYLYISAKWKYASNSYSDKYDNRFQGVLAQFDLDALGSDYKENTISKIYNNSKASAKISGVDSDGKGMSYIVSLEGAPKSATWKKIRRDQFYPFKEKPVLGSTYYLAVKVYTLTKDAVRKNGKWTIPKNGTSVTYMSVGSITAKKIRRWKTYYEKLPSNTKPKKGTVFYKKLTGKAETKKVPYKKLKYKPKLDGVAVSVQAYNDKTLGQSKFVKTGKLKAKDNPKKLGLYRYINKKYVLATEEKPATNSKKKQVTYYRKKFDHVFDSDVPKQIAYFNFVPPSAPEVKTTVGKASENHKITYKFNNKVEKSNRNERYDTVVNIYYSYGILNKDANKLNVKKSTRVTEKDDGKTKMPSSYTSKSFTITLNPNRLLKNSEETNSGNRDTYISSLEEGEWLIVDMYYYNRGLGGTSVANKGPKSTLKKSREDSPSLSLQHHIQKKFMWPYDTVIDSVEREGQHYRIRFHSVSGGRKDEKRSTGSYTLQRLGNFRPEGENVEKWTNSQWLDAAAAAENWKDIVTIGSGEKAAMDNVRDAAFEPSHRTYYRIKSEAKIDGIPPIYSTPKVVQGYASVAKASRDSIEILEVSQYDDGRAIRVVVGFTRTATSLIAVQDPPRNPSEEGLYEKSDSGTYIDNGISSNKYKLTKDTYPHNNKTYYEKVSYPSLNSNGTELSWSTKKYAWSTTEGVKTYQIYDEDIEPSSISKAVHGYYLAVSNFDAISVPGNPKQSGLYTKTVVDGEDKYDLTNDTTVVDGKTYYKLIAPTISDARKKLYSAWETTKKEHFQSIYITELDIGQTYYIRARRFLEGTDTTVTKQFGPYGKYVVDNKETPVIPVSRPKKVKLSAPSVLRDGSAVDISWTYDEIEWTTSEFLSSQPQEAYTVYVMTGKGAGNVATATTLSNHSGIQDSSTYTTLTFQDVENYLTFSSDPSATSLTASLYIGVRVKVGGTWSDMSNVVAVTFVKPPTATVVIDETVLQTLPLRATLITNDPQADAIVRIYNAGGCSSWMPYGQDRQADGTIVYSMKYHPNWTPSDDGTWQTVWTSENTDIDLRDGGDYTFEFTASHDYDGSINGNTSFELYDQDYAVAMSSMYTSEGFLKSSSATFWGSAMNYDYATDEYKFDSNDTHRYDSTGTPVQHRKQFHVEWSHQAVSMPLYTGRNGTRAECCIFPPKVTDKGVEFQMPELWPGASADDVIDMYRVTPDGAYLVKTDILPGQTVVDTMPMYSNYATCRYRFATRTSNGDIDYVEVPSGATGHCVRFDWGNSDLESHGGYSHLELPYNLKWNDQWTKDVRVDALMDGSRSAYWRGGVDRRNSLSTALLKFEDPEQVERVRALAQHPGPVFVRLPDGCAFCANVDVNTLDNTYDSQILTASFTAQEISMIPQYSIDAVEVRGEV